MLPVRCCQHCSRRKPHYERTLVFSLFSSSLRYKGVLILCSEHVPCSRTYYLTQSKYTPSHSVLQLAPDSERDPLHRISRASKGPNSGSGYSGFFRQECQASQIHPWTVESFDQDVGSMQPDNSFKVNNVQETFRDLKLYSCVCTCNLYTIDGSPMLMRYVVLVNSDDVLGVTFVQADQDRHGRASSSHERAIILHAKPTISPLLRRPKIVFAHVNEGRVPSHARIEEVLLN